MRWLGLLAVLLALALSGCGSTAPARVPGAVLRPAPVSLVVGLGDSVMAGTHCHCAGPVVEYARGLQQRSGRQVRGVDLGDNGATTRDLNLLLHRPGPRGLLRHARVVLVIVGANDLLPQARRWEQDDCPRSCYLPAVRSMGERLRAALDHIHRLRSGSPGQVLVADYWNVFLGGQVGLEVEGRAMLRWSRAVTRAANRQIRGAADSTGDTWVDLYGPFMDPDQDPTPLLAGDGDHPNARGVQVVVRRMLAATRPIQSPQ